MGADMGGLVRILSDAGRGSEPPLVGNDCAAPDWLPAGGGAGVLALLAAALSGPDRKAAKQPSEVLAAWRGE
jgi:hypothetical protein